MSKLKDKDLTKVAAGGPGNNYEDLEPDTGDLAWDPDQDGGGGGGGNRDDIEDLPGRGGGTRGVEQG